MSNSEKIAQAISEEVIASCKAADYVAVLRVVIKRLEEDLKDTLENGDGDMEDEDEDTERE